MNILFIDVSPKTTVFHEVEVFLTALHHNHHLHTDDLHSDFEAFLTKLKWNTHV